MKIEPCLGVPVVFDKKLSPIICESRGIWRWKKVVVGPGIRVFSAREQQAILLHEVGHCKLKHLEQRIAALWLVFVNPWRLLRLCLAQEFEADHFAAECGFGTELIRVFARMQSYGERERSPLHPSLAERIERLQRLPPIVPGRGPVTTGMA